MSLFRPKNVECEISNKFKEGYITEEDYNNHITRKREARSEMEKDKETEKFVYTVDPQTVVLSPKSNTLAAFTIRRNCACIICVILTLIIRMDIVIYGTREKGGLMQKNFHLAFIFSLKPTFFHSVMKKIERSFFGVMTAHTKIVIANIAINLTKQY
ncbi:unnamed protein product [Psylliodes chrysocephalus]|uniref:Uncharacterized protein n=1 Tax=Psylliodes chrysocephalus TaxID=3402493 RepID=A0A9P0CY50_9CUCU|nr:unnamed protein product [Psylliodes chrysocephala]